MSHRYPQRSFHFPICLPQLLMGKFADHLTYVDSATIALPSPASHPREIGFREGSMQTVLASSSYAFILPPSLTSLPIKVNPVGFDILCLPFYVHQHPNVSVLSFMATGHACPPSHNLLWWILCCPAQISFKEESTYSHSCGAHSWKMALGYYPSLRIALLKKSV